MSADWQQVLANVGGSSSQRHRSGVRSRGCELDRKRTRIQRRLDLRVLPRRRCRRYAEPHDAQPLH
jgi:hypothetical protein